MKLKFTCIIMILASMFLFSCRGSYDDYSESINPSSKQETKKQDSLSFFENSTDPIKTGQNWRNNN